MCKQNLFIFLVMLMSLKGMLLANEVNLYVDGVKLEGGTPISLRNTTFIPVGILARELDLKVEWHNPCVEISNNIECIQFNLDDVNAYKDQEIFFLREAPFLHEDRVYVPLRAVSELFGYSVKFFDTDKRIEVQTDLIVPPVKNEKIEFEMSPDGKWGIWSESNFYNNHQYKSLYLRSFTTGKSYKLHTTHGFYIVHWTPESKIIFSGLNEEDKAFVHLFDPEQMKIIESIQTRIYDYDQQTNILYYYHNNQYISYDLNERVQTEISRDEYIRATENL